MAIRRVPVRDKVRNKTLPISGQFKRKVKAADKLVLSEVAGSGPT
jgi:hypothetical protein